MNKFFSVVSRSALIFCLATQVVHGMESEEPKIPNYITITQKLKKLYPENLHSALGIVDRDILDSALFLSYKSLGTSNIIPVLKALAEDPNIDEKGKSFFLGYKYLAEYYHGKKAEKYSNLIEAAQYNNSGASLEMSRASTYGTVWNKDLKAFTFTEKNSETAEELYQQAVSWGHPLAQQFKTANEYFKAEKERENEKKSSNGVASEKAIKPAPILQGGDNEKDLKKAEILRALDVDSAISVLNKKIKSAMIKEELYATEQWKIVQDEMKKSTGKEYTKEECEEAVLVFNGKKSNDFKEDISPILSRFGEKLRISKNKESQVQGKELLKIVRTLEKEKTNRKFKEDRLLKEADEALKKGGEEAVAPKLEKKIVQEPVLSLRQLKAKDAQKQKEERTLETKDRIAVEARNKEEADRLAAEEARIAAEKEVHIREAEEARKRKDAEEEAEEEIRKRATQRTIFEYSSPPSMQYTQSLEKEIRELNKEITKLSNEKLNIEQTKIYDFFPFPSQELQEIRILREQGRNQAKEIRRLKALRQTRNNRSKSVEYLSKELMKQKEEADRLAAEEAHIAAEQTRIAAEKEAHIKEEEEARNKKAAEEEAAAEARKRANQPTLLEYSSRASMQYMQSLEKEIGELNEEIVRLSNEKLEIEQTKISEFFQESEEIRILKEQVESQTEQIRRLEALKKTTRNRSKTF